MPAPVWPDAPRLAPSEPLPPYRHVPGETPHPVRDPRGHSRGALQRPPELAWRFGIDLYHQGYLWEAHEAWEVVWKTARDPAQRELARALIQTAAALLKRHMGEREGERKLARAARARLAAAREAGRRLLGLDLDALIEAHDRCFRDGGVPPKLY